MGTTGKEETCLMPGGSTVIQLQPCQAAVLSDQPIKGGMADVPFRGSAPRVSSRDAEGKVGGGRGEARKSR